MEVKTSFRLFDTRHKFIIEKTLLRSRFQTICICSFLGTVRVRTRIRSSHSEGDFNSLPPEPQQGNVEYKLKLVNPTSQRLEHLVTQMKWRLREGQGEAIYEIGVEDNGLMTGLNDDDMVSSIETLREMSRRLGATIQVTISN